MLHTCGMFWVRTRRVRQSLVHSVTCEHIINRLYPCKITVLRLITLFLRIKIYAVKRVLLFFACEFGGYVLCHGNYCVHWCIQIITWHEFVCARNATCPEIWVQCTTARKKPRDDMRKCVCRCRFRTIKRWRGLWAGCDPHSELEERNFTTSVWLLPTRISSSHCVLAHDETMAFFNARKCAQGSTHCKEHVPVLQSKTEISA